VGDEELMDDGAGLLVDAVGQLSAEDVDRVLKGLPTPVATELVRELLGNKLEPRRLKNVGSLVLGPLQKRPAPRLIREGALTLGELRRAAGRLAP